MSKKCDISISLILPVYNEEEILKDCIDKCLRVLNQDFKEFEIIIVDDGSRDSSLSIAMDIAATDSRILVVPNLVNLNQGVSIQRGFTVAKMDVLLHNGIDLPFNPEDTRILVESHLREVDVLVLERNEYSGATRWRKFVSAVNTLIRRALFPSLSKGLRDVNYIQFYSRNILKDILPLAKSPAFTTPEMIFRARFFGYRVRNIPYDFHARPVGDGSLGKLHDITWSFYDMLRFRFLAWIGLKTHGRLK